MRVPHFVAFIILGASILIPFPTTTIAQPPGPKQNQEGNPRYGSLPSWFTDLDEDGEGQVTLQQWREAGNDIDEFREYDLNGDGIITADEVLRYLKKAVELKFNNGRATYEGTVEESADETYQGKKSFKIFTVKLAQGKTYLIDQTSNAFQAFLHLEDADGNVLAENSSPNRGGTARIVFRPEKAGTYRIIATSLAGFRTGAFLLSVRLGRLLPEGLPPWFKALDKSGDGQITFQDWRNAGRPPGEFRRYDLNGDGVITAEEVLRFLKKANEPKKPNKARASVLPKGLPSWFKDLNGDGDGQVTFNQWRNAGRPPGEFRKHDLNGDGIITADEVLRNLKKAADLKLHNGQATYNGTVEEADEEYRGKKSFRVLTVRLEQGKTYQIDHTSKAFQAFLYLEDSDGEPLEENSSPNVGGNSRIVFRADRAGTYRIIATSQGGFRTGPFSLSIRSGLVAKGLPSWFTALDKDGEGQVTLQQWREAGKPLDEFRKYDLNGDDIITAEEVLRSLKKTVELKLNNGRATYNGTVEESADETYRGKKSFKVLTIKLEQGKTYQIDHISPAFQAFLHLEDAAGNLLAENSSRNIGGNSRLVFHADKAGTYRVIATSLAGFRTGPFSLSVRSGLAPKGLPMWFTALDQDGEGQVTFQQWREAGNDIDEFHRYDLNGDGIITAEEVLRYLKKALELKLHNGEADYKGTIEEADEPYRGKKSFKVFTIKVEQGKTYEIDFMSAAFQGQLYLEDSDGNPLEEVSSRNIGGNVRIVIEADKTGTIRIIATSVGGFKTGDFVLSVRLVD